MGSANSRASSADSQSNTSTRPTSQSSSALSGDVLGTETKPNPEDSTDTPEKSQSSKGLSKTLRPKHPRQPNNMNNSRGHNNAIRPGHEDVIDLSADSDVENQTMSANSPEVEYSYSDSEGEFVDAFDGFERDDLPNPQNRQEEQYLNVQDLMQPPDVNQAAFYDLPALQPPSPALQAHVQQDPEAFIQGELYNLPHRGEPQAADPDNIPWNIEDEDLELQRFLHDQVADTPPIPPFQEPADLPQQSNVQQLVETRLECIDKVLTLFPGICRDHVSELYDTVSQSSDQLIAHILDKQEKGTPWPKAKEKQNMLKRKRDVDEEEEAIRKYAAADRGISGGGAQGYVKRCLQEEFSFTPMTFIGSVMTQNNDHLFPAYRVLEEAERTWDIARPSYNKLKNRRVLQRPHLDREAPVKLEQYLASGFLDPLEREVLLELQAARKVRKKADDQREAERQAEKEEELNVIKAQAEGTMSECGCCFGDFPLNRMVHCNNEVVMHWFCKGCAKQTAENEIGNSKYELHCMSMDGCKAGFANDQRTLFLDEKTFIALERNEQEAMLRMAGIENLASCPFCPYAAEYPPVEVDREFRCAAPDCEKVSCRLCKLESHIPKSCEENSKDNGLSIRRQIEEAMSAALIRTCNKCGTPFVKEEGCNKMTCTRNGCYNVQCYVCSKSCGYDHFDDRSRGGKTGNCPLFESVEQRHDDEVQKAEKEALARVRAEHPEYTEEDLKVKMSENVAKDDQRRKENDPRRLAHAANHLFRAYPGRGRHRYNLAAAGRMHVLRNQPLGAPLRHLPLPGEVPLPGELWADVADDLAEVDNNRNPDIWRQHPGANAAFAQGFLEIFDNNLRNRQRAEAGNFLVPDAADVRNDGRNNVNGIAQGLRAVNEHLEAAQRQLGQLRGNFPQANNDHARVFRMLEEALPAEREIQREAEVLSRLARARDFAGEFAARHQANHHHRHERLVNAQINMGAAHRELEGAGNRANALEAEEMMQRLQRLQRLHLEGLEHRRVQQLRPNDQGQQGDLAANLRRANLLLMERLNGQNGQPDANINANILAQAPQLNAQAEPFRPNQAPAAVQNLDRRNRAVVLQQLQAEARAIRERANEQRERAFARLGDLNRRAGAMNFGEPRRQQDAGEGP